MPFLTVTSDGDSTFLQVVTLAERVTIGRDTSCTIPLPDPEKHISRLHATIEHRVSDYLLTVNSKTNPLFVNDKAYLHGKSTVLKNGDRVVLRSYVITVAGMTVDDNAAGHRDSATLAALDESGSAEAGSPTQQELPSSWLNILNHSPAGKETDPFGLSDLIVKPAAKQDSTLDPFSVLSPTKPTRQGSTLIDTINPLPCTDQFDPLGHQTLDPMAALDRQYAGRQSIAQENSPARPSTSLFGDLLQPLHPPPTKGSGAVNSNHISAPLVDLGGYRPIGTRSLEHVHDINLPYTPPPIAEAGAEKAASTTDAVPFGVSAPSTDDPFADVLRDYLNKAPVTPTPSACKTVEPDITFDSPASNPVHPVYNQRVDVDEHASALINAFRSAAGMEAQSISYDDAIAYMESAGMIVRAAIEGVSSLLASRSMLKGELGAEDRTMVASRDNNPLKLMPEVDDAMRFLFENQKVSANAYLTPMESIAGACEDLVYHELGSAAGMRAAVEASIRRFNPQLFETKFDKSGKKMVLVRKAALWDFFVENYNEIEKSMADDVGRLFERDFRRAYDAQIRKLKKK